MKKNLDFICIGAAKAATSTLFELIKNHPDIYIPPAKEVPYFNDDETYEKGWDWYMKTFFSDAKKDQVVGTLTPQYMSGFGVNTPERIAERIEKQLPKVKIIIMLRHPIERAYSHYKMHKRHGYLNGSFEESVARILKSDLTAEHNDLSQRNAFLFSSEYGRIVTHYHNLFTPEQVKVIFTDELEKNPQRVLQDLFAFLNIDTSFEPAKINRRTNQGGSQAKIKYLNSAYLHKFPIVKYLWQHLVPPRLRKRIYLKVLFWNTKVDDTKLSPSSKVYNNLVKFFSKDIAKLEKSLNRSTPWLDWNNKRF